MNDWLLKTEPSDYSVFDPAADSRDVDRQNDALVDEISRRLEQKTECSELFTLRWRVV